MPNRAFVDYTKRRRQEAVFSSPQAPTQSQTPVPVQQLSDGRVRYSDGSVKGTATVQQPQAQGNAYSNYLQNLGSQQADVRALRQSDIDRATQRYKEDQAAQQQNFANYQKSAQQQSGDIQKRIDAVNQQLKNTLGLQEQQAQLSQGNLERTNEQNTRELALAKQTADRNLRNKFASLGTADSGGYQGYSGQQTALERDYLRQRANSAENLAANKQLVDLALGQAKIEAESKANEVIYQYEGLLKDIQQQLAGYPQELQAAQVQAYRALEDAISGINKDYLTQEQAIQKGMFDVSLQGAKYDQEQRAGKEGKSQILTTVRSLLQLPTGQITGAPNIASFIPGTEAQTAKNVYEQLKGMLSLQNRQLLKGSGSISNYEAETLDRAASALGTNLSDQEFINQLNMLNDRFTLSEAGYDPQDIEEYIRNKY